MYKIITYALVASFFINPLYVSALPPKNVPGRTPVQQEDSHDGGRGFFRQRFQHPPQIIEEESKGETGETGSLLRFEDNTQARYDMFEYSLDRRTKTLSEDSSERLQEIAYAPRQTDPLFHLNMDLNDPYLQVEHNSQLVGEMFRITKQEQKELMDLVKRLNETGGMEPVEEAKWSHRMVKDALLQRTEISSDELNPEYRQIFDYLQEHHRIQAIALQRTKKPWWQTMLKETAYIARGVAIGAALTPVFLTEFEEAGINLENNNTLIKGLMGYTFASFALENYFNRGIEHLKRITFEGNKWKEAAWYMGNLLYSAFPAYLLWESEWAHREDVGSTGFDAYVAYATFLGTALFANQIILTQQMGYELFKPESIRTKERGIERLDKELTDLMMEQLRNPLMQNLYIPGTEGSIVHPSTKKQVLSYIVPTLTLAPTLMAYAKTFDLAGRFIDPSEEGLREVSYIMGTLAASMMSYIEHKAFMDQDLWNAFSKGSLKKFLMAMPQGLYKSIPYVAMAMKGTSGWPWVLRAPLVLAGGTGNAFLETLETQKAFEEGILRLPKVRDTTEGKKQHLKERLL